MSTSITIFFCIFFRRSKRHRSNCRFSNYIIIFHTTTRDEADYLIAIFKQK